MRVWLMTVGEPLPTDPGCERLLRTGLLAESLVGNGHEVVWWTSSFDHVRKRHRASSDREFIVDSGFRIRLLHGAAYCKNISFQRFMNHRGVARKFREQAAVQPQPDVILCSLPTVELCVEATAYGRKRGVPVVLDVRDQWPDMFLNLIPSCTRRIARVAGWPLFRAVKEACSQASAITGITQPFVDWAVKYAQRAGTARDRSFPMGYREQSPTRDAIRDATAFWRDLGVSAEREDFIVCFFGSVGRHFEFDVVFEAAESIATSGRRVQFVMCGSGPALESYRRRSLNCPNVIFPGWVNSAQIWTLLRMSAVGLAPYISMPDFVISIPNKPIEYLSAGRPVISSLQGVLADLLEQNECGITYGNRRPDQLAQVIIDCYENPARLDAMSANAAALYRRQFVAENVYGKMQAYLADIAATTKLARAA
jgi:glycosyltransferase involved in cell wall biosynthesis